MNNNISKELLIALLLLSLQVLLFNRIIILNGVMASVYVLLILRFPYKMNASLVVLLAAVFGGIVDLILYSGGVHASAAITLAFLRKPILRGLLGKEADGEGFPSVSTKNNTWFLTYAGILIAIHQLWLVSVETMFNTSFWFYISRFFLSTIITLVFVMLIENFIASPKSKRL